MDEKLFESEQEWRREIWKKLSKVEEKVTDLRVKVALISGGTSVIVTLSVFLIEYIVRGR
jgi:hypothetical protein